MNDELFEQLLSSVKEADEIIAGKITDYKKVEFPDPEVKSIRAKTGLSQNGFANVLGVSKRTLENWEQGRRSPTGPARALLKILDANPKGALTPLRQ